MKINMIIKNKRLEQSMTQEQLAACLGVSAPAVNKWEKGTSYPDITLLPPLARLLKVDMNTLLSFKEELTDREIAEIMNETALSMQKDGVEQAFQKGIDKIHEYPNCDKLILNLAMVMFGSIYLAEVPKREDYKKKIMELYEHCANSEDTDIKNQAVSLLVNQYIGEKDYERAQSYIDKLPSVAFDKSTLQGNLYKASGEQDKAAGLFEWRLMKSVIDIHAMLLSLMEIAQEQGRPRDAMQYAQVIEKSNELFQLWTYNAHAAYFQLYVAQEDKDGVIESLEKMLPALSAPWDTSKTWLYRHMEKKVLGGQENSQFLSSFLEMIRANEDGSLDFIQEDPRFTEILDRYSR